MKIFYKDLIKHETKIMEKRNDTINKLRKSIISPAKKNSVPMTTIKNTIKSEIIIITLENIEALLIMLYNLR